MLAAFALCFVRNGVEIEPTSHVFYQVWVVCAQNVRFRSLKFAGLAKTANFFAHVIGAILNADSAGCEYFTCNRR